MFNFGYMINVKKLVPDFVRDILIRRKQQKHYDMWIVGGKVPPTPHLIKQDALKAFKKRFNIDTLIETGTCAGDMVFLMRDHFRKIYSIELSDYLFSIAKQRVRKYSHIELYQGDSGYVLPEILSKLNLPALFWLDGHYSGDVTAKGELNTPIVREISAILQSPHEHILLIDDVRCFDGSNDYPAIGAIIDLVIQRRKNYIYQIENDIISFYPSGSVS